MHKPTWYFLCTGNSARSQMAEGFARALYGDHITAKSAGTAPTHLHPLAVRVMAECGIDISAQASKPIDSAQLSTASLVVTLCGDARDRCPVLAEGVRHLHWPLPDPAGGAGTEREQLDRFRAVRDRIVVYVRSLAQSVD